MDLTFEKAVKVLNFYHHRDEYWFIKGSHAVPDNNTVEDYFTEFEVVAIAEKYLESVDPDESAIDQVRRLELLDELGIIGVDHADHNIL